MKYLNFILASTLLSFVQSTQANSFSESFEGTPKINLNLYIFAADIDGKVSEINIEYDINQPFSETVKNLDRVFMGYLDFNKGDWGVYVDKQLVKTSENKDVFTIPVAVNTKLDQTSYGIYYQAYKSPEKNKKHKLIVEPTIGIHRTEIDATLSAPLVGTKEADIHWNEFFWGTRLRYNFDSPWNIASEVTVGEKDTLSAHAYVGYNIPFFKQHINLRAGYRYFKQDYRTNNFHWDITQSGPVIGFNIPIF